jgi:hypothetical protein
MSTNEAHFIDTQLVRQIGGHGFECLRGVADPLILRKSPANSGYHILDPFTFTNRDGGGRTLM